MNSGRQEGSCGFWDGGRWPDHPFYSPVHCSFLAQTYAEMDPTTAALEKEHEAVSGEQGS